MCETRDLGIKWPQWHALGFEGQVAVDMRYVCPKDVKKMLMKQAGSAFWRKWVAKHEYEELKEVSGSSQFWFCSEGKRRRKGLTSIATFPENWFWKEAGCRKDSSTLVGQLKARAKACHKEEGTEKHGLYHCPGWKEVRRQIPEAFRKWEQKARTTKKEWKVDFKMKKRESEKHQSWCLPAEGFLKVMLPRMGHFWVLQESGEHVVGQWCNWIMMENWDFCMGCMAS